MERDMNIEMNFFLLYLSNLKRNLNTNVGDEGGFAPNLKNTEEQVELGVAVRMACLKIFCE